jgi:hypothetical protein
MAAETIGMFSSSLRVRRVLGRNVTRQDAPVGRKEEYVVEGQRLLDDPHDFRFQTGIILSSTALLRR